MEYKQRTSLAKRQELTEQRIRFETERRRADVTADEGALRARHTRLLPSSSPVLPNDQIGMYTRVDELDTKMVPQRLTEVTDAAVTNTYGKYHIKLMENRFPIAGTQLKLENQQQVLASVKKKLLLAKPLTPLHAPSHRAYNVPSTRGLDAAIDKALHLLSDTEQEVTQAQRARDMRLATIGHRQGLVEYWNLFWNGSISKALLWLQLHSFPDINLPVVKSPSGAVVDKHVGMTPLMAASQLLHVRLVQELLQRGASPQLVTSNGDSALHLLFHAWKDITQSNYTIKDLPAEALAISKLLLSHGADPNAQNTFGETPLYLSIRASLLDVTKLLLDSGADISLEATSSKSSLQAAQDSGNVVFIRLLRNYTLVQSTIRQEAQYHHDRKLLHKGPGALSSTWSSSPDLKTLLHRQAVEKLHVPND